MTEVMQAAPAAQLMQLVASTTLGKAEAAADVTALKAGMLYA